MSNSADLLDKESQLAVAYATTPAATTGRKQRNLPWLPISVALVGLLSFIGALAWYMMSGGLVDRPKNNTAQQLDGGLSPDRDYEWTEGSPQTDNWKQTLAWLSKAKIGLSATAERTERDPLRGERWEVEYRTGHTLESYVRELDAIGIEIGLLNSQGQVTYLSELTNATPKVRNGKASDEQRYYMLWRIGSLNGADKKLFAAANITIDPKSAGQWVAHFFSPTVEQQMYAAELKFANGRPLSDIRRTTFSIKPTGRGFEMGVWRQEYQDGSVAEASPTEWQPAAAPKKLTPKAPPSPGELPMEAGN